MSRAQPPRVRGGVATAGALPRLAALLALGLLGVASPSGATGAVPEPLAASLEVEFLPGEGGRTRVSGVVAVPAADVRLNPYGFYNLQLEGQVTISGRTYDHFAYRFDVPGRVEIAAPLALAFQRSLRPGSFHLEIHVKDVQSGRSARIERLLEVPRVAPLPSPSIDDGAPPSASTAAVAAPAIAPALRIVPPPRVAVGRQRFAVVPRGTDVARVDFSLDGRMLMARTRPPFSVEIDLGERAVRRRLRAEAFDAAGARLGSDEVVLNGEGDGFAVRLRRPPATEQQSRLVHARAEVIAPRGARVDRVELFLDERPVAVLARAPFERTVALASSSPTLLRAVAHLADGTSAEDSVVLNAPNAGQVDVDLVELYTAVVDSRGRPVRGLSERDFRIFEEGQEQRLDRFSEVADLPVHVALVLDTSTSMTLRLPDVRRAASAFLREMVRPHDEVTIVTFDDVPRVRVDFTHDPEMLANGLEGLQARGGTALYDSILFTLDLLQEVRGQRVLVLLSDGLDERSGHTADEVRELARRAAVTLYAIGIVDGRSRAPTIDRALLERLAEESGGRSYFVSRTSELDDVYAEIEHDVRSRYLLAYYSSHAGETSFRLVDVKLGQPRLAARTIRGYYP